MSPPVPSTRVPIGFLIGIFAAATVVGVVIAYLGIHGSIGTGIP